MPQEQVEHPRACQHLDPLQPWTPLFQELFAAAKGRTKSRRDEAGRGDEARHEQGMGNKAPPWAEVSVSLKFKRVQ